MTREFEQAIEELRYALGDAKDHLPTLMRVAAATEHKAVAHHSSDAASELHWRVEAAIRAVADFGRKYDGSFKWQK
jgi:hypothetical protein